MLCGTGESDLIGLFSHNVCVCVTEPICLATLQWLIESVHMHCTLE